MSKSTKVIAALGVAAGLGVAALPAATFAVQSDSATAGVEVTVTDTISITVTGTSSGDPVSADTMVDPTDDTLTVPAVKVTMANDASTIANGTTAVVTNNTTGYTLSVAAQATGSSTLKNGSDTSAASYDTIAPFASPVPAGDLAGKTSRGWGILASNTSATVTTPFQSYAGVTDESQTILSTNTHTAGSANTTNIAYGFNTKVDQKTGVYTGYITYTATTNPGA